MARGPRVLDGAVIRASNDVHFDGRGEGRRSTDIVVRDEERVAKIRQGYFCHRCLSDTETAFDCPNSVEHGFFCAGFTPESLRVWMTAEYRGSEELWPHAVYDAEDARMEREMWTRRTGIWVPGARTDP